MAFLADEPYLGAGERHGVCRAVYLVTGLAALSFHRSVLKNKRSALIAMALVTAWLVGVGRLHRTLQQRPVRVMAIDARHRAFRQLVAERPLEVSPYLGMAAGALCIDFAWLARDQTVRTLFMNRVTAYTTDLVLGVAAVDATDVSRLIKVTLEAGAVGFGRLELGWIANIRRRHGLGVLAPWSVAGFAGLLGKSAFLVGFHQLVRILLKRIEDVLMTTLAGYSADELGGLRSFRGGCGGSARLVLGVQRENCRAGGEQHSQQRRP